MVVSEIKMYELLKNRIGEKEAETFVQILEEKMERKIDQRKNELVTKNDVAGLRAELLRTIYFTSLGQLLAIVGSVESLILMLKK